MDYTEHGDTVKQLERLDSGPLRLEDYPHPSLTVDCVVFGFDQGDLKVLLIERGAEPFQGMWALPGGFVRIQESLEKAARRELSEEAGITKLFLEQLYTFGEVDRDPRVRVVTVAYYASVDPSQHDIRPRTDARAVEWFPVSRMPRLAFDHRRILEIALARLRAKIRYQPVGFELLPEKFTLSQLQH